MNECVFMYIHRYDLAMGVAGPEWGVAGGMYAAGGCDEDDHCTSVVERYQCHTHTPTHTPAQTHVHAFAYIHTHTQVRVAHGSVGVGGEACSAAAVLCSRVMARLSGEQRRGHRVRA